MARVRSPEDIRREMELVNNPIERARAGEMHAARDDEAKRPVSLSSSIAITQRQREEDIQNQKAIAAVIAQDDLDWESSTPTTLIPTPAVTLSVPAWLVTDDKLSSVDPLPRELQGLFLDYADYYLPEEKERVYRYPSAGTFFTRYISQKQYRLEQAANDLLNEGKIDIALALVKVNGKEVLNVPTCGRDRFGTRIEGRTLLQMVGMAGDVNLREKKTEEKEDHGAVELLAQAGGFTKDEVRNQLSTVLFSEEAKRINEARKNSVLKIFIEFAENILKRKKDLPGRCNTIAEFKAAQARCQPEINKLRKDLLEMVSNKTVTSGYILDSQIFVDLTQWFEKPENLGPKRFDGWWSTVSDLFWVNGYGSLQYVAAARDAQVCRTGIGRIVDDKDLPARSLNNPDGTSHFVLSSKLGDDFFLGYYGRSAAGRAGAGGAWGRRRAERSGWLERLEIVCRAKATALQNLCDAQTVRPSRGRASA